MKNIMHKVKKLNLGVVVTETDGADTKKFSRGEGLSQRKMKRYEPRNWMHIEALEDGLEVSFNGTGLNYSLDSGLTWTPLSPNETTPPINNNKKIFFKGPIALKNIHDGTVNHTGFTINKSCNIGGNVMSLRYDDFENQFEVTEAAFAFLFADCTTIKKVDKHFLPATKVGRNSYGAMFKGCSSLEQAPDLPATELYNDCYSFNTQNGNNFKPVNIGMFQGCSSLEEAPELPATELGDSCYYNMFKNCVKLKRAPKLPSLKLSFCCYAGMFYGCSSLEEAPELPATELATNCYGYREYYYHRTDGMFEYCVKLKKAPKLPAKILKSGCYTYMFRGCTNLNYIEADFIDIEQESLYCWLDNVAEHGTFVKNKDAEWDISGASGIPTNWDVILK